MKPHTKVTSYRLDPYALNQLEQLAAHVGKPKTEVIQIAIDRMYQQEIIMNIPTITVQSIKTKPEHDPYTNISGIVSRTYLKLDPRDHTVWVTQEYNDNSTPSDEWHGLVLTWQVPGHPTESAMREWIDDNLGNLMRICSGFVSHWDGSNHVGRLNDDARATREAIEFELDNGDGLFASYYEHWSVEDWTDSMLSDISATTTDKELRQMANDAITSLDSNQILDDDEDGVYRYFAKLRDELSDE